ncbi:hypothetical protein OJAV_G00236080, partial [Oryzias javanicus]
MFGQKGRYVLKIGAAAVERTLVFVGAAGTMSSLQSLRELISERLAAAAEEIFRLCEGTIVQYEQELCRQRRLLDVYWKPQLQLHQIVLPQHWVIEEDDLCNQQRNFREEQNDPIPTKIKEELEEPELLQIKKEQEEQEPLQIEEELKGSEPPQIKEEQEQLDLKQEIDTLMEIPTYERNENSEADLNIQQSFNVTDGQDEELSQHEESTSTTGKERDPQNRDQRERRDRIHVQNVDNSHITLKSGKGTRIAISNALHMKILPQHWMIEEEELCNQQRNFIEEQNGPEPTQTEEERVEPELLQIKKEQEEQEPLQIKEELEESEPLQIKEEQEQLDLKQETE